MKKILFSLAVLGLAVLFTSADTQLFKTALRVTVLDDSGNVMEGATVRLFASEKDYKEEKNAIKPDEASTDDKGVIWFRDIEAKEYWVLAEKGDKNNWESGIKTEPLLQKKVNRINIIIE